jgi:hypothetical protein
MNKNILLFACFFVLLTVHCGSEWCDDDCNQKFVFTIKNTSPLICRINFYSWPYSAHDTVVYLPPNIRDTINILPESMYVDSYQYHIKVNGLCSCYNYLFEYCTRLRVRISDSIDKDYYIYPGCPHCMNQSISDTFPEKELAIFYDTITIP